MKQLLLPSLMLVSSCASTYEINGVEIERGHIIAGVAGAALVAVAVHELNEDDEEEDNSLDCTDREDIRCFYE